MGFKGTLPQAGWAAARTLALVLALAVLLPGPARAAAPLVIQEDFTSTASRDPIFTTALWDTVAGELRLPPQTLQTLDTYNTAGSALSSALLPGVLLVADGTGGLVSLDVSDPADILLLDTRAGLDQVRDLALRGDLAVCAIGTAGLQIFDVSDPADLRTRGTVDVPGYAVSVGLSGNWAYLAQSNLGIAVIDATDPDAPSHVRDVATLDWARGVAPFAGHLAVADGNAGLTILATTDPSSPTYLTSLAVGGTVLDVTIGGGLAYLAVGATGLVVVDVSDPAAPAQIGALTLGGTSRHAAVRGDSLWVSAGSAGLFLVDVSVPAAPVVLDRFDSDGEAYHATADGTRVWLSDGITGVRGMQVDPEGLNPAANAARSLNVNPTGDLITKVRLISDHADSVKFEVTVNGGGSWRPVPPDDTWVEFPTPGKDLRWRVTLVKTGPYPGPVVRDLTLTCERLLDSAEILSIADVPQDDGGQVRVTWAASRFDTLGADPDITEYSLYRRYDLIGKAYPPGSWDYLLTVPADGEQTYSVIAPTLADSSSAGIVWTAFFVRARSSNGALYDSPVDSGYSVNDLQPPPPTGFSLQIQETGRQLRWDPPRIPDFSHFALYRADSPLTPPQPGTLLAVSVGTSYFDAAPGSWYYLLTVVDQTGRQSDPASPSGPSAVPAAPGLALRCAPNPFNPLTTIEFEVPGPGSTVSLEIYDARGRLVRTLLRSEPVHGTGRAVWDGTDNAGRQAASGLYHCLLRSGHIARSLPLTLVR